MGDSALVGSNLCRGLFHLAQFQLTWFNQIITFQSNNPGGGDVVQLPKSQFLCWFVDTECCTETQEFGISENLA
ncbi:MAG: hypothetical protein IPN42_08115 [Methylococcaceae bacterium]|nr:hypothetical protein [Methylococcaceae bacterium]